MRLPAGRSSRFSQTSAHAATLTSGKCLDVTDFGTNDGMPLQQWDCYYTANRRWRIERVD